LLPFPRSDYSRGSPAGSPIGAGSPACSPSGISAWRSTSDGIDSADQAGRTRCNADICNVQGRSSRAPFLPRSPTAILPPLILTNTVPVEEENPGKKISFVEAGRKSTERK
jgi:hypothetical protein